MNKITTREQLIKSYLEFFKSKGHKVIPSSSLIPENDPTVLFTTAGMHPLVPYLLGQKHPLGKRIVNVQKCIRTGDIEEVGDGYHHTFFEMLGNWSFGDYFKEDAIKFSFEFLTKNLRLNKESLEVTCFKGDNLVPKDTESAKIWKDIGINKIKFLDKKDNWWGPAGKIGPCGPDTEMFVNGIEIWNDVFMEYNKDEKGNYQPLKQKNVDTGMGVERTLAILLGYKDNYKTTLFQPLIKKIEKLSHKKYEENEKEIRIIADHIRTATFILGDNKKITPSNTEQGYILRRLIRRAIRYGKIIGIQNNFTKQIAEIVIEIYPDYTELKKNKTFILSEIEKEENRFRQNLSSGLKYFNKISQGKKTMSGKDAFLLFQSYGFPIEMTEELAKENKINVDLKTFELEFKKHQELSRTSTKGKFSSGLADNSEQTTKLHTATHLLNEALRHVLKDSNLKQRGSNITSERLRFDFNFSRKLTEDEIKKVEDLVNAKIQQKLLVIRTEMPFKEAIKKGYQGEFGTKYPEIVSTYEIKGFSKEICTGPHVKNTKSIGHFKIIKEESSSAGIRRIKATVN